MQSPRRSNGARHRRKQFWFACAIFAVLAAFSAFVYVRPRSSEALPIPQEARRWESGIPGIRFADARRQAVEFISYDSTITLTPEQQAVMSAALSAIPAPCCDGNSIGTCCCPCNLAKSTWGLSKLLITERQASTENVRAAATAWLQFTNPAGYTGNACFTGGCGRAFDRNGCGGMNAAHVQ